MGIFDRLRRRKVTAPAPRAGLDPPVAPPNIPAFEQPKDTAPAPREGHARPDIPALDRANPARVAAHVYSGVERLEVVGESHCQSHLWRIVGGWRDDRVRHPIVAVLVPEPHNPYDSNAISVQVDGGHVGYLRRQDAATYAHGITALIERTGANVALKGVVLGGGNRRDGRGLLGVWLDHDPSDFRLRGADRPGSMTAYSPTAQRVTRREPGSEVNRETPTELDGFRFDTPARAPAIASPTPSASDFRIAATGRPSSPPAESPTAQRVTRREPGSEVKRERPTELDGFRFDTPARAPAASSPAPSASVLRPATSRSNMPVLRGSLTFDEWLRDGDVWLGSAGLTGPDHRSFLRTLFDDHISWAPLDVRLFADSPGEEWLGEVLARAESLSPHLTKEPAWPAVFDSDDVSIVLSSSGTRLPRLLEFLTLGCWFHSGPTLSKCPSWRPTLTPYSQRG